MYWGMDPVFFFEERGQPSALPEWRLCRRRIEEEVCGSEGVAKHSSKPTTETDKIQPFLKQL
jgi:hypothetical protein